MRECADMASWFVVETLTGAILHEFEPAAASWKTRVNEPETLAVSVPVEQASDWVNLATPWKHSLLVDDDGHLHGGPIQPHDYTQGEPLNLTARGLRSLLARRVILPPEALRSPLVLETGEPNDVLDTHCVDMDLGSIGAHLVAQACSWPGFALPLDIEPRREGTHERSFRAVELTNLDTALRELSGVHGGPDFTFLPRRETDTRIRWHMISGTETKPLIAASEPVCIDIGSGAPAARLQVRKDPSRMGSLSWANGGRGVDAVMIASAHDPYLVDNGVPLMDIVDSTHTSVTEYETLESWAKAGLHHARGPAEFWSIDIPDGHRVSGPRYSAGDYCEITVLGDPYVPDGIYRRRILEITKHDGTEVSSITCGESYDRPSH